MLREIIGEIGLSGLYSTKPTLKLKADRDLCAYV